MQVWLRLLQRCKVTEQTCSNAKQRFFGAKQVCKMTKQRAIVAQHVVKIAGQPGKTAKRADLPAKTA
jgi:hypothetical protein